MIPSTNGLDAMRERQLDFCMLWNERKKNCLVITFKKVIQSWSNWTTDKSMSFPRYCVIAV
jgi:hypothetical protein